MHTFIPPPTGTNMIITFLHTWRHTYTHRIPTCIETLRLCIDAYCHVLAPILLLHTSTCLVLIYIPHICTLVLHICTFILHICTCGQELTNVETHVYMDIAIHRDIPTYIKAYLHVLICLDSAPVRKVHTFLLHERHAYMYADILVAIHEQRCI